MDAKNIIALVNAGYTKAEIDAMEAPADPAPEAPEAPADPAPAADPQPAEAPAAQPQQDQILQALERLTNSIMQHNINQTVTQPAEHTVQDALAAIIAPPAKTK